MVQGRVWIIGIGVLAAIAGGCNGDSSPLPTAAAARELRTAARRTLAEPSFRVSLISNYPEDHHVAHGEYLAPDRTRLIAGRADRISIGGTMYQRFGDAPSPRSSPPNDMYPDLYYRVVMPPTGNPREAGSDLSALVAVAARAGGVVTRHDGQFTITSPRSAHFPATRTSFRIEHGRVTDVTYEYTLHHKNLVQRYHYFDFGAPISIKAPPVDQTREMPTVPRCPTVGSPVPDPMTGVSVCSDPAP